MALVSSKVLNLKWPILILESHHILNPISAATLQNDTSSPYLVLSFSIRLKGFNGASISMAFLETIENTKEKK